MMNKRGSKHGALEEIPWKSIAVIEEFQPTLDDMIFNYLKKHKVIAGVFLEDENGIPSSTVNNHLRKLSKSGKIEDLGYKRMKLKGRTMFHRVHLFGVKNGRT